MRAIYIFCSMLIAFFLFASCEEVVDIDLKSAPPKYVIDASISEGNPCFVTITKSQAFSNNNPYEHVSGAVIELTDENGETDILTESDTETGIYISHKLGVVNMKYHIKVTIDDVVAEASATIPQMVPINQVYIYEIKVGNSSWYSPSYTFNDPPEPGNYYYTLLYVNDKLIKTIYINSDEYRNGKEVHRILFFNREDNNDQDLKTGDNLMVEMQSIDKGAYTYYKSLSSVAAGGATNPLTNFSGNVLGLFKAYNPSYGSVIVSNDAIYTGE